MMKITPFKTPLAAALSVILLQACSTAVQTSNTSEHTKIQNTFFSQLSSLCGKKFVGASVYPKDPNHDFAGKKLVATIASCSDKEIRIPFVVGNDHSRTWIISRVNNGLQLKHDHRHEDGTPDEVTMYGGMSDDYQGKKITKNRQFFHADAHTANLIPAAKSNVWMLEYKPETNELVYYLERHQEPRYKASLKLSD